MKAQRSVRAAVRRVRDLGLPALGGRDASPRSPVIDDAPSPAPQPAPKSAWDPEAIAVVGMVERFSPWWIVGWISVPRKAKPVRVTLHCGPVKVASTWANMGRPTLSGVRSDLWSPRRAQAARARPPGQASMRNIPSPAHDRRNSHRQVRTFAFRIQGLWPYLDTSSAISVRVRGQALPISGHGMYLTPTEDGELSLEELQAKLEAGYVLSQFGLLQLSKKLDTAWQQRVMTLYERTREVIAASHDYEVFFIYGTLLGAVREGGFIGHDIDLDLAYLSRHRSGHEAAQELVEVALALVEAGLDVECTGTSLHLRDIAEPDTRIDVFHTYFDDQDQLAFPWGVAGTSSVGREDWAGTQEVAFADWTGRVPVIAEQLVEALYGPDWRRPKQGFDWDVDRIAFAAEGILTEEQINEVYWANFYARTEYDQSSSFFAFVDARPDTPDQVFDIGCGDGRDACAFGKSGRTVVGIDRSTVGIEHARAHAKAKAVDGHVAFEACDVGDPERLARLLARRDRETPALFYLRFFLHAISEDVQHTLMTVLRDAALPGDVWAAEFRTSNDRQTSKAHDKHYRRYQDAQEFLGRLREDYLFEVLHSEEGTGLSVYRGEDPVLCRIVARRV